MRRLVSCCILAIVATAPAAAADLHLRCSGSGTANKTDTITTQRQDSKGKNTSSVTTVDDPRPFSGDALIEIVNGIGRIRVPGTLLPDVHGGSHGWFELRTLSIGDSAITAKAAITVFDHPDVRLDRISGAITIDGNVGTFSGQCKPFDPATTPRAF